MRTSETNVGYLFTKDYFRLRRGRRKNYRIQTSNGEEQLEITNLEERSTEIIHTRFDRETSLSEPFKEGFHTFDLQTVYPGLLVGSGYMHDIKSEKALKLGFYFDHTTGLPVIPGSSVKGVLRSAFKVDNGGYVQELLDGIGVKLDKKGICALEKNIFDSAGEVSVYCRDKFFDAFPVATSHREGLFLADDYITPHPHPLKDPKPIRFLKVGPGVTFRFVFELHDFEKDGVKVTAEQKLALFRCILLDLGVGAKTNVGYGQFRELNKKGACQKKQQPAVTDKPREVEWVPLNKVKRGDILRAKVLEKRGKVHILQLYVKGYQRNAQISYAGGLPEGSEIEVKVSGVQGKGNNRVISVAFYR